MVPQPDSLTSKQQWRAFWVAVSVSAMTILDLSKVNVTLPSIEQSFGASASSLQLIVSGYVLAFGLTLVPMGRLGDQTSRKRLFLIGLALFGVTSAACAMAPNEEFLLVARLLQGVAAGIQMPQVVGTIQRIFQGEARGRAFGLFGSVIGISTAFGPTLGGLMIALGGAKDGWRWVFWMNVPLSIIVIVCVLVFLPTINPTTRQKISLDPIGIVLFAATVMALMIPFLFTTGSGSDNPQRWWLIAVSAVFAAAFVAWESRYALSGRAPLIPLKLFRIPSFRNGTLVIAAYFSAIPAMFLVTTLFLQIGMGIEPVYAGMVSIGFALTSAYTAWLGGRLVAKRGRAVVVLGLIVILAASILLHVVARYGNADHVEWYMAAVMVLAGAGGGFVVAPNQALTLGHVPVRDGGLAGSVGQLGQRIGTAVGTAIALSLFYASVNRAPQGDGANVAIYRDGFGWAMTAVSAFLIVALILALGDLRARKRAVGASA